MTISTFVTCWTGRSAGYSHNDGLWNVGHITRRLWTVAHPLKVMARLRPLAQAVDRRGVRAIFLIMLGGGAGVEIAVTLGLLVACSADTDHVAMKEGLGARQRRRAGWLSFSGQVC